MSKGKLDVSAIGNLGRDPEMSVTTSGLKVAKFSVCANRKRKGEETSTWINVVTFDKLAEIVMQYLSSGDKVAVDGELEIRKYQRKDGTEGTDVSITANKLYLLGSKKSGGPRPEPVGVSAGSSAPELLDDDLPF